MKTVADAVREARVELGDTREGNFRWADADMVRFCGEAVVMLRRARPSVLYGADMRLMDDDDVWVSSAHEGMVVPVEPRYWEAVPAYIVHRCLARDVTDDANAKVAAQWLAKFEAVAGG